MLSLRRITHPGRWLLLAMLVVTVSVYWPGLSGGWLFDDYPNIVDNHGVQPDHASLGELVGAALSSPSSTLKRPLSSLSFAANYLAGGLDPWGWKLVNLIIHLLNGMLVFVLAGGLLRAIRQSRPWAAPTDERHVGARHARDGQELGNLPQNSSRPWAAPTDADSVGAAHGRESANAARAATTHDRDLRDQARSIGIVAALIAGAWMLLPINLTGVLYVVQRMESLANLFVLLGLVGYVAGRRRMLAGERGLAWCATSLVLGTAIGVTAKETAVMLPLYAFLVEWIVFGFSRGEPRPADAATCAGASRPWAAPARGGDHAMAGAGHARDDSGTNPRDWRVAVLFVLVLLVPMLAGLAWLVPHVLDPATWATRDFTLGTRLLSEARIVVGYIAWTLVPLPHWLSFYHDSFHVSTGLLSPWTTLASIIVLAVLVAAVFKLRRRWPLVSLGIALFLGCHVLTGTILPLELVYEHRNYFASFGLLLALVPLLAAPGREVGGKSRHFGAAEGGTRNSPDLAEPVETPSVRVDSGSSLRSIRNDGDGGNGRADVGTSCHPGADRRSEPGIAPSRHPGADRRSEPGIHFDRSGNQETTRTEKDKMDPGFLASLGPRMTAVWRGFLASLGPRMTGVLGRFRPSAGPGMTEQGDPGMTERMHTANPESRILNPGSLPFPLARGALLAALGLWWIALTLATSIAWSSSLRLAQELAARAPESPRAQYELGRSYIIFSNYDPASPFTPKVYAPLERAAKLPDSSILPEQALIFFNARMHRPLKDAWWDSLIAKLKARPPGVQDESSLIALTKCARSRACKLPSDRMLDAFLAALSHPNPNARLYANYGDFAWNILNNHQLGLRATRDAVTAKPSEPVYHITLARMYLALGDKVRAREQLKQLRALNYGGRLDSDIAALEKRIRDAE